MACTLISSPAAAAVPGSLAMNAANFVSSKLRRDRNWNNYISWKEQMLCLVQSQGLVGFIDGKAPPPSNDDNVDSNEWRRTDWLVKGWILGALSDEVIQNVLHLDCARDVWLVLENEFSPPLPAQAQQQEIAGVNEYLGLYKAVMSGEWETVKVILEQDRNATEARVSFTLETPLHIAVGTGRSTNFVSNLVDLMHDDSSLAIRDKIGYNPLHVAAITGNHGAAEILVHRLPHLLYLQSNDGSYPLHLAAYAGHRKTLEFLISQTRDDLPVNPFAGDRGLQLLDFLIFDGFLDMALDLVDKHPHLARMRLPTVATALNMIAYEDKAFSINAQFNFWERLVYPCIQLEMEHSQVQSFDVESQNFCTILDQLPRWRKMVHKLHSTLWRCISQLVPSVKRIHEKKLIRQQALRLVKCICKHMEPLGFEEASTIYKQAVLTAARVGNHDVIEEIVATFPSAVRSEDPITRQNLVHLAVRYRCEKVFNLMYQTTNHRSHYCSRRDTSGNSILHLAATLAPPHKLNLVSGAALQMQREIQWFKEANKFVNPYVRGQINNAGKTAEMIFTEEHRELKVEGEKWMKDTANSCTIAAALIVTVVFAAAITVPGGNESDSGYPMLWENSAFTIFAVSDAVSLFTSATSLLMFLSILTSRYAEQDFLYALPKRLCIGLVTLFLSILFMMAAFSSTVFLVFGRKHAWVLIPAAALTCLPITSFVLLQFPLLIAVISSTYGKGIFGKQSNRPFH